MGGSWIRAKHEKISLKTPALEQEMEGKLVGIFVAPGEQEEKECFRGPLSLDNPRSEFRETPNHLLGFIQVTRSLLLHQFGGAWNSFSSAQFLPLLQLR